MRPLSADFPSGSHAIRAVGAFLDHGVRAEGMTLSAELQPALLKDLEARAKLGLSLTTIPDTLRGGARGALRGAFLGAFMIAAAEWLPTIDVALTPGFILLAFVAAGFFVGLIWGALVDQGAQCRGLPALWSFREAPVRVEFKTPLRTISDSAAEQLVLKYGAFRIRRWGEPSGGLFEPYGNSSRLEDTIEPTT